MTDYLRTYGMTAHELTMTMVRDVLYNTGITATAGIGTNLFLAKIAMDIEAKKSKPDKDGVRIAALDEMTFREKLWTHRPLTDFWRIGKGISQKLEAMQLFTLGDVARASLNPYCEDRLYKTFGVNAELIIDHAWGWEPVTVEDIRQYRPSTSSISSGQVLQCPYDFEKGRLIVREMTELLVLDLVRKHVVTKQIVLDIGYDRESLEGERGRKYAGPVVTDPYGRKIPKAAHGTGNMDGYTSSTHVIMSAVLDVYDRVVHKDLLIRRVNVTACNLVSETEIPEDKPEQLDMFTDYEALKQEKKARQLAEEKERRLQNVTLAIQDKFGKNAMLKGMNLMEGGTADYAVTGNFSGKAAKEAEKYGRVNIACDSTDTGHDRIPAQSELKLSDEAKYFYYCANNTVYGTEWQYVPETKAPLVCDMSSDILSRPVDVSRFGLIYAGAQKNMAPAGLTVVILDKNLAGPELPITPSVMSYKTLIKADSMLNTPPCWCIYMLGLTLDWLESQGGVAGMEQIKRERAGRVYAYLDESRLFKAHARADSRSDMNVTFRTGDPELDAEFVKGAAARGLLNLKGHKVAGGMRASLYNAMPMEGVTALIEYMKEFETKHHV